MTTYRYFASGCFFLMVILLHPLRLNAQDEIKKLKLSREVLWDKMYASWLGQMVGNIYGLPHEPVKTRGIRIIGDAGSSDHWYSRKTWFTSITELSVYEPIPGIERLLATDTPGTNYKL